MVHGHFAEPASGPPVPHHDEHFLCVCEAGARRWCVWRNEIRLQCGVIVHLYKDMLNKNEVGTLPATESAASVW